MAVIKLEDTFGEKRSNTAIKWKCRLFCVTAEFTADMQNAVVLKFRSASQDFMSRFHRKITGNSVKYIFHAAGSGNNYLYCI